MNTVIFNRVSNFDSDLPMVIEWVGEKFDRHLIMSNQCCIKITCTEDLTQPEMDTITANAAAEFIKVTFE